MIRFVPPSWATYFAANSQRPLDHGRPSLPPRSAAPALSAPAPRLAHQQEFFCEWRRPPIRGSHVRELRTARNVSRVHQRGHEKRQPGPSSPGPSPARDLKPPSCPRPLERCYCEVRGFKKTKRSPPRSIVPPAAATALARLQRPCSRYFSNRARPRPESNQNRTHESSRADGPRPSITVGLAKPSKKPPCDHLFVRP